MNDSLDLQILEAQNELKSVRDIIRFGISLFNQYKLFYGHGTDNIFDEVVYLVLSSLHLPLDFDLNIIYDSAILRSELNIILKNFTQRVKLRKPAPYITNQALIQNYYFYIDERAIIPRSFIPEILLNDLLTPWIQNINVSKILDLCTGNGSIAIIASEYFPEANVIATDIDENAMQVAQINIKEYLLEHKIKLIKSDLFKNIPKTKFDLILSNPPYVDGEAMKNLTTEYKYEPMHALYGGEDGLRFASDIINNALCYLSSNGLLVVEIGDNKEQLEFLYQGMPFTWFDTKNAQGFVFVLTYEQLSNYFENN